MTNERAEVLEQQVDALAAQVAELRWRLDKVIAFLTGEKVAGCLGLDALDTLLITQAPLTTALAAGRHREQRDSLVRDSERNAAIDRLLSQAEQRKQFHALTNTELPDELTGIPREAPGHQRDR